MRNDDPDHLMVLAEVLVEEGAVEDAAMAYLCAVAAVRTLRETGWIDRLRAALEGLEQLLAGQGRLDEARRCALAGIAWSRRLGDAWEEAVGFRRLAHLDARAGDVEQAVGDALLAIRAFSRAGDPEGVLDAWNALRRFRSLPVAA